MTIVGGSIPRLVTSATADYVCTGCVAGTTWGSATTGDCTAVTVCDGFQASGLARVVAGGDSNANYAVADYSTNGGLRCSDIPDMDYIVSQSQCDLAAVELGLSDVVARVESNQASYPIGCFWYSNELLFNQRTSGSTCLWCTDNRFDSICKEPAVSSIFFYIL